MYGADSSSVGSGGDGSVVVGLADSSVGSGHEEAGCGKCVSAVYGCKCVDDSDYGDGYGSVEGYAFGGGFATSAAGSDDVCCSLWEADVSSSVDVEFSYVSGKVSRVDDSAGEKCYGGAGGASKYAVKCYASGAAVVAAASDAAAV